jgi:L-rhamnose-H+ transport protein
MNATEWGGLGLVVLAGIFSGGGGAPIKLMRRFRYEHWAFSSQLLGLVLLPWAATLLLCPNAVEALAGVEPRLIVTANLCSLAWGVANVLCCLCLVRIGFSLTIGLLTGIGLPIGVLTPMVLKGSGRFGSAPALGSPGGLLVLAGVAVMLVAVALITRAGFGRDAALRRQGRSGSGFAAGLAMAAVAGLLQAGLSFAFVYSQGPIVAALTERGAAPAAANLGVWAATLPGGALVNLAYCAWLLVRNRSWGELTRSPRELGMSLAMGVFFFCFVASMGQGMRALGASGASVGFGVYQALQLSSSQAVGFVGGEWHATPLTRTGVVLL